MNLAQNQQGVLISFSYSEIRFLMSLIKIYSKMPKPKRYFSLEYLFFPGFFLFHSMTDPHKVTFLWAEYAKFNKMHQGEYKV